MILFFRVKFFIFCLKKIIFLAKDLVSFKIRLTFATEFDEELTP